LRGFGEVSGGGAEEDLDSEDRQAAGGVFREIRVKAGGCRRLGEGIPTFCLLKRMFVVENISYDT
jgi:hypothetical protein